jgi:transposase
MPRTAVVNQIRGLLLERGLTLPKGRSHVVHGLPEILTDPALRLSGSFRVLGQLQLELEQLTARIEQMDAVIQQTARENEACQRLTAIPGIGSVTATALVAAIGNGAGFRRGKDLAAWGGWFPESIPRAANRSCSASAGGTRICEGYSCKEHES